jgi:hypothetical protein
VSVTSGPAAAFFATVWVADGLGVEAVPLEELAGELVEELGSAEDVAEEVAVFPVEGSADEVGPSDGSADAAASGSSDRPLVTSPKATREWITRTAQLPRSRQDGDRLPEHEAT